MMLTQDTNGVITCQINGSKKTLPFAAKNCETKLLPRVGDKVTFDIYQVRTSIVPLLFNHNHKKSIVNLILSAFV